MVVRPKRARLLHALLSVTALLATGVVLTLIPIWYRASDSWSVNLVLSPLCVVAAIALTAAVMFRAPRWARVAICGLVAGTVHLATVATFYDVSSIGWAVVWAVGTGSIVVAVVGGMLTGVYQVRRPANAVTGVGGGPPAPHGDGLSVHVRLARAWARSPAHSAAEECISASVP